MTNRGVLLNREITLEMNTGSKYEGKIDFYDEIGLLFSPLDLYYNDCFITWHSITRIHIKKIRG